MSASKCGRSAAIWGEIGFQERLMGQILSSSETACINPLCAGGYADLPLRTCEKSLVGRSESPAFGSASFLRIFSTAC
jgi:hypothetical protein